MVIRFESKCVSMPSFSLVGYNRGKHARSLVVSALRFCFSRTFVAEGRRGRAKNVFGLLQVSRECTPPLFFPIVLVYMVTHLQKAQALLSTWRPTTVALTNCINKFYNSSSSSSRGIGETKREQTFRKRLGGDHFALVKVLRLKQALVGR